MENINTNEQINSLLIKIDEWIGQCEKNSLIFKENNMVSAQISTEAMIQAYWNVKQFIEVNA